MNWKGRVFCVALLALLSGCVSSHQASRSPAAIAEDTIGEGLSDSQKSIRALKVLRRAQQAAVSGEVKAARSLYKEALKLYVANNDFAAQAAIHNDLGLLAKGEGDLKTAQILIQKSEALASKGDAPVLRTEAMFNLAGVFYEAGQFKEAEAQFTETIAASATLKQNALKGLATSGRGNVRRKQNQLTQAIDDYKAALIIWSALDRKQLAAITWMNIGYSLVLKGDDEGAANAFQETINTFQGVNTADSEVLVPHMEEMIRRLKQNPEKARERVLKILGRKR